MSHKHAGNAAITQLINLIYSALGGKSDNGHTHKVSHTPEGSVTSTFTGTEHSHTFKGDSVTSDTPSSTTTVHSITGLGTLPSASLDQGTLPSLSFNAGTLPSASLDKGSHSFSAGTLPTLSVSCTNHRLKLNFSAGTLPSSSWNAPSLTFNAGTLPSTTFDSGKLPSLTFDAGTLPSRSSINVPKEDHTHSVASTGTITNTTASGSVSSSFKGTAATITTQGNS